MARVAWRTMRLPPSLSMYCRLGWQEWTSRDCTGNMERTWKQINYVAAVTACVTAYFAVLHIREGVSIKSDEAVALLDITVAVLERLQHLLDLTHVLHDLGVTLELRQPPVQVLQPRKSPWV